MKPAICAVALSLLGLACKDDTVPVGPAPRTVTSYVRAIPRTALDVLFVVDDSASMTDEQANLSARIDQYLAGLAALETGMPDLHLAVVSTDVGLGGHAAGACAGKGDDGRLREGQDDACAVTLDGAPYLSDAPDGTGGRTTNYAGSLPEAFGCIAHLGASGCGFEQPLESMRRALAREQTSEATGFLRPDAALAIVILTDEDDCSATASGAATVFDPAEDAFASPLGFFQSYRCFEFGVVCDPDAPRALPEDGTPVHQVGCVPRDDSPYLASPSDFVDFLATVKDDPSAIAVTLIGGEPAPVMARRADLDLDPDLEMELMESCTSELGGASPPIRLARFAESFGSNGQRSSICSGDVGQALSESVHRVRSAVGLPCLAGELADLDSGRAGIQPFCEVEIARRAGQADEIRVPLAACADGGSPPCWQTSTDAPHCGDLPSQLRFDVDLGGAAPSPDVVYVVDCQI